MRTVELQVAGDRLSATLSAGGEATALLRHLRDQFVNRGYRLEETTDTRLEVRTPTQYSQTRQNPLLMLSTATVTADGEFVRFQGELGGLVWMRRFLYLFPAGLGLLLAAIFLGVVYLTADMPVGAALLTPVLALGPWVVIAPVMVCWLRGRAMRSVEALLHNAQLLARQDATD